MINKISYVLAFMLFICTGFIACTDDDKVKITEFTLTLTEPEDLNVTSISDLHVTFKNVNTGKITTNTLTGTEGKITLNEGLYNITVEGKMNYIVDEKTVEGQVKGYKESVNIVGATSTDNIKLFLFNSKADFVIEEVYFAGNTTPEGKQYSGDQYFKIYNNSDSVLYADGLVILESEFTTSRQYDYTPDIMSQAMTVAHVYAIPGNGKEYPVQPGESILICDKAIDHTVATPNSFDLRNANFEWYNDNDRDVDNPEVPNLDIIYSSTLTIWTLNNQGLKAYAIARMGVDKQTFLKDYLYECSYVNSGITMTRNFYKFPNEWIIDAVNISNKAQYIWNVVDASLDMGFTYCGEVASDKNRYNKSVRRKVLSTTPDGRKILKDTNNSTEDFEAKATPSLKQ
ncbi:MAG TPA: DUF4876 domain-containing protein [Candidatus Butyricimonas faecavium]|nr:DUF4876 domain-containing protein [Candidatus Butyricimonas faecavium]